MFTQQTQPLICTQQQPVVDYHAQPPAYQQYPSRTTNITKKLQILGIIHIINGVIILGLGIAVSAMLDRSFHSHATALWNSFFFILTGIIGTFIFCYPRNRYIVMTHSTFSIISIVIAAGLVTVSAIAIKFFSGCHQRHQHRIYSIYNYYGGYDYGYWNCRGGSEIPRAYGVHGSLVLFGLIELVLSILSTIYSLKVYNCCQLGCGDCDSNCHCCYGKQGSTASQQFQLQPLTHYLQQPSQSLLTTMQPAPNQVPNESYFQPSSNQIFLANHRMNQLIQLQQSQSQNQQGSQQIQFHNPPPPIVNSMPTNPIQVSQQQPQVVTSSSGQQFVLMPIAQSTATVTPSSSNLATSSMANHQVTLPGENLAMNDEGVPNDGFATQ